MERTVQRMENINRIFTEMQIINNEYAERMEKHIDSLIKVVESLKKSQKSSATVPPVLEKAPLVLENNGSDIQCRVENVIVVDDNNRSTILNVLSGIKTISGAFDTSSWLLLSSIIMTTVVFIFNLAFEVYTFNTVILFCRRVYDPGGNV